MVGSSIGNDKAEEKKMLNFIHTSFYNYEAPMTGSDGQVYTVAVTQLTYRHFCLSIINANFVAKMDRVPMPEGNFSQAMEHANYLTANLGYSPEKVG